MRIPSALEEFEICKLEITHHLYFINLEVKNTCFLDVF